jgi:hypothetical protein
MSNLFKAGGAQETIEGYMLEGIVSAMTGATLSGGQATFDYPSSSLTGAAKKRLGNLFGSSGQINSLVKADAKRTGSPDSFSSITNKLISDLQDGNFEGVTVKKFATGGSVGSGTDTVPALLTPGEFVINKKSAQKIGYGSLNRMNKVGKYAKGGVVAKKVQAFADGGEVGTSSTQVSIDVEPVNQALQSLGSQAFLTTETMTQVAQALSNLGITTNKVSESKIRELYSSGKITAENAKSQVAILKESTQRLKNIKTSLKLEQQDMRTKRALGLLEKSAKDASDSIDKMGDKSDSDTQSPDNKDGLSATMKMNAGLMALSTAFSVLAPTIDETSTYTDHLLNNFSQLAIQASTAAMIIGNFKDVIPLDSLKQLGSAFSSAKSKVASFLGQSAASEAKEAAANKIVTKTEMDEAKANVLSGKSESMKGSGGMGGIGKGGGMAGIGKAGMTLGTGLMAAATATAVVAAGFYAVYNAQAEYSKQLKDAAIEAGNAEEASKRGGEEVAANQMATRGTTGAISGGVVGGAIGAIFGPIGIAVGAAIGALVGGLIAIFMPLTAAEKAAIEAAKARAAADALASKAAKALAEQNDAVSEAMKGFESGTLGVYDVIKASSDAMATAAASRKAAEEAQIKGIQESTAYYYSITGTLRRILSWLGLVSSPEDIMQPSLDEDKKRVDEARKAEVNAIKGNTGLTVLMKQVAAAGGGFDDFLRILEGMGDEGKRQADIIRNNGDAFKLLSQRMENLSKEAERTRKAFDAMNLGFHGVNAAAGAVTHALDNYLGAQEAGNIKLTRSIATLEAGVTSAAMGMDPAVFQDALNDAGSTLAGLGATQDQINKFKQNMSAINQAQVTFAKSSQDAKNKMVADFKRGVGNAGSLEAKKQVLADSVVMNLGPDVPKEVKSRISDAIMAGKLSEDDMQKIMDGNFEPLSKVLGELGKQTLDQVLPALKQQAEALKKTLALRAQILKLEQAYIDARKRTIDVEMEAASIKEEFGGPAVTTQQKESAILRQANLDSEGLGVGSLQAGSAAELTKSNAAIQNELNRIAKVRNDVATGSVDERVLTGEAGMNLDNREERLNKLAQSNYETTKKLIDLKRQEIKVIQARNKAEKDAMKSLMAGDIEAFLDKQAAIAAGAAIAIGDVQGAQRFGSSAIGGAFQNFEDMQAAGVQDYFGQKIGGRGGLLEQTGTAFGFGKNQAQVLAGSTQEEETLKAEARALADTLPQTAKIQENSAKQGLINAHLQYDAAKLQMEAAKARVAKATSKEAPKKAVVTQTEDTKVEQEQPIKKNKPAPSPISVALAKAIDAATGKTKAQDKLAENTSFVSPSEQARQQAEANKVATTSPAPIPMSGDAARAAQESQTDSAATQAAADSAAPPIQSVAVSGADKQASGASSAAQAPAFDSALFTTLSGSLDKNSQSMTSLTSALSALSSGIELKGSKMVDGAVNNFGQHIDKFTTTVKSLESLSLKVNVGNSNVSVTITEPAFLRELTQNLKSDILTEVQKKLDSLKLNQDGTTNTKSQSGLPT